MTTTWPMGKRVWRRGLNLLLPWHRQPVSGCTLVFSATLQRSGRICCQLPFYSKASWTLLQYLIKMNIFRCSLTFSCGAEAFMWETFMPTSSDSSFVLVSDALHLVGRSKSFHQQYLQIHFIFFSLEGFSQSPPDIVRGCWLRENFFRRFSQRIRGLIRVPLGRTINAPSALTVVNRNRSDTKWQYFYYFTFCNRNTSSTSILLVFSHHLLLFNLLLPEHLLQLLSFVFLPCLLLLLLLLLHLFFILFIIFSYTFSLNPFLLYLLPLLPLSSPSPLSSQVLCMFLSNSPSQVDSWHWESESGRERIQDSCPLWFSSFIAGI